MVAMPETTVCEYRRAILREDNIRLSRQTLHMEPEAKTKPM
jgi:hypothetical protein